MSQAIEADYIIVEPENGDDLDLVAWVTMDNESGKSFENAHIKLMAGDVSKIQPQGLEQRVNIAGDSSFIDKSDVPSVTEKAFDDYHLYTLTRPTTLLDRETKQVEFTRARNVHSTVIYVYDGLQVDSNRNYGYDYDSIRRQDEYGTNSNTKVFVMREIVNSKENGLGIPLPKGNVRFYRRDADGQLEFTGENVIDHTPKDETLRIYTGNAFDLTGERRRVSYKIDWNERTADESFEIKVRNHKAADANVRVVEHLYRGATCDITDHSTAFLNKDAHTIEYNVAIPPDGEQTVTYTVHYTW